ncbi:maleylpyruvate isomerase N-terminal domain-containing protein [Kitasatospora aburaviensis]
MGGDHVRAALDEVLRTLGPHTHDRDWSAPAGPLEWSCRETAVHIAHDLLAYAGQLAARPADRYLPLDLTVPPAAGPAEVLTVVTACARLLATALDAAPSDLRAWHFGPFDPPGFAAMGSPNCCSTPMTSPSVSACPGGRRPGSARRCWTGSPSTPHPAIRATSCSGTPGAES